MNCSTEVDWIEAKRVIRYLEGTKDLKLTLSTKLKEGQNILQGYSD